MGENDLPILVRRDGWNKVHVGVRAKENIEALILDPKIVVWNRGGLYFYFCKEKVLNAARELRNELLAKNATKHSIGIELHYSSAEQLPQDVGKALEALDDLANRVLLENAVEGCGDSA